MTREGSKLADKELSNGATKLWLQKWYNGNMAILEDIFALSKRDFITISHLKNITKKY